MYVAAQDLLGPSLLFRAREGKGAVGRMRTVPRGGGCEGGCGRQALCCPWKVGQLHPLGGTVAGRASGGRGLLLRGANWTRLFIFLLLLLWVALQPKMPSCPSSLWNQNCVFCPMFFVLFPWQSWMLWASDTLLVLSCSAIPEHPPCPLAGYGHAERKDVLDPRILDGGCAPSPCKVVAGAAVFLLPLLCRFPQMK